MRETGRRNYVSHRTYHQEATDADAARTLSELRAAPALAAKLQDAAGRFLAVRMPDNLERLHRACEEFLAWRGGRPKSAGGHLTIASGNGRVSHMAKFTDDLRKAIRRDPRTQHDIAKAAGLSPIQLSRFLRDIRGLTTPAVDALVKTLGLKLTKPEGKKGR